METLWVDLNNIGKEGVRLICKGTIDELNEKSIILHDGLELLIWDYDQDNSGNSDNLTVNAIIKYSDIDKCWIAQFENKDLMHESERRIENSHT
jgi:hypothetical protein